MLLLNAGAGARRELPNSQRRRMASKVRDLQYVDEMAKFQRVGVEGKAMNLRAFSVEPVCEKCGGTTISRVYHDKDQCEWNCGCFGSYLPAQRMEHHRMTCRTCQYLWQETVIAKETLKP